MGHRRVLASVEQFEGELSVSVYRQDGNEVERVACETGDFRGEQVERLLRGWNPAESVRRTHRPLRRTSAGDFGVGVDPEDPVGELDHSVNRRR